MPLNIQEPRTSPPSGIVPFALGFRPLFLLAGLSGLLLMVRWLYAYHDMANVGGYYGTVGWHAHEMLFGYTAAVIAGFLLTAVRNWTSVPTITGLPLALLSLLWLLARLLPFSAAPGWLIAVVDLLFLPATAVAIAIPISRVKQWHNLFFAPLLLAYGAGSLLFHLELLGLLDGGVRLGTTLGIGAVVTILAVMGGRVIGFFIERGLNLPIRSWPLIERLCVASVVVYFVAELILVDGPLLALVAIVTAAIHLTRLVGWFRPQIFTVPLLWVLYTGYGWIACAFLLKGLSALGWLAPNLALHAFTVGGIGVMTVGMMARVSIGHTGRQMVSTRLTDAAFLLINLAALARVILPLLWPQGYVTLVLFAGLLWILAFLLFVIVYLPILLRPRVDGMPG